MIKVIMHGCNGKMGQVIAGLIREEEGMELVAGIDVSDCPANPFPVVKRIADCPVKADVVIDFSHAGAVEELLSFCAAEKLPCVLCTTGLSEEQLKQVEEAAKHTAIFKSANMSLGVNVLLKLVKEAAAVLASAGFDMEVVEKHHRMKVDAPSGTALALAAALNEELNGGYQYIYERNSVHEKRGDREIGISSVRGGTIVGEHDVIFAGMDEALTFSHAAYSRAIFGKGAVQAAKFLAGKPAGLYGMDHIIG